MERNMRPDRNEFTEPRRAGILHPVAVAIAVEISFNFEGRRSGEADQAQLAHLSGTDLEGVTASADGRRIKKNRGSKRKKNSRDEIAGGGESEDEIAGGGESILESPPDSSRDSQNRRRGSSSRPKS